MSRRRRALRCGLLAFAVGAMTPMAVQAALDEPVELEVPIWATGAPVAEIVVVVVGARRTEPAAVLRMMDTRAGAPLWPDVLRRDLARLRATQMIAETRATVEPGERGVRIRLEVKDRWSTFLYAGTRRGGARTITRLGVFDHNVWGRLFRVWGELNSGADIPFVPRSSADRIGTSLHAVLPRVGGTRLTPIAQWTREFFDYSALRPDGDPGLVYDRHRRLYAAGVRYDLQAPASIAILGTTFEDRYLENSLSRGPGALPPSGRTSTIGAELQIGLVDEWLSRYDGWEVTANVDGSRKGLLGSDFTTLTAAIRGRAFWVPARRHNTGVQVALAATTGRSDSHLVRAGGLFEIRGFLDSTFVARRIARANLEHRIELWAPRRPFHAIVQAAGFVDAGLVAARAGAVAGLDFEGPVLAGGAGLRINIVPLARAVARIDVARGMYPLRRLDLALGVQQFF